MKMLGAGSLSLLGVVLSSVCISDATRETMSLTEGGVTFEVVRYDDNRSTPYRLKFRQDGTGSLFQFKADTHVTTISAGSNKYKVRRCKRPSRKCVFLDGP